MKYLSTDEITAFEFHDANIKSITVSENDIVWVLTHVNLTSANSQHSGGPDLCIAEAEVVFKNAGITEIQFLGYETHDSQGNLIEKVAPRFADKSEFTEIHASSDNGNFGYLHGLESSEQLGSRYRFCFCVDSYAVDAYFITIECDHATVTWENYLGEAWYEKPPFRK